MKEKKYSQFLALELFQELFTCHYNLCLSGAVDNCPEFVINLPIFGENKKMMAAPGYVEDPASSVKKIRIRPLKKKWIEIANDFLILDFEELLFEFKIDPNLIRLLEKQNRIRPLT